MRTSSRRNIRRNSEATPEFLGKKIFFAPKKMQIVKVKGQQNRFLYENVKMSVLLEYNGVFLKITLPEGEIFGRLPKTDDVKRVFYRRCNNKKRLFPFPQLFAAPCVSFPPKEFAGDVLLRADNTVENVVLKFVLEGERVIPINEWLSLAKERYDGIRELAAAEGRNAFGMPEMDEFLETCYINAI